MNRYLLDTHILLWTSLQMAGEVSADFFSEIEEWQKNGLALLSPISSWEISLFLEAKQLDIGMSVEQLWATATEDGGLEVVPLSARILIESTRLPDDIHRDPADRILIATAREHGLTLVTRDKQILQYAKQGHLNARRP